MKKTYLLGSCVYLKQKQNIGSIKIIGSCFRFPMFSIIYSENRDRGLHYQVDFQNFVDGKPAFCVLLLTFLLYQ